MLNQTPRCKTGLILLLQNQIPLSRIKCVWGHCHGEIAPHEIGAYVLETGSTRAWRLRSWLWNRSKPNIN